MNNKKLTSLSLMNKYIDKYRNYEIQIFDRIFYDIKTETQEFINDNLAKIIIYL